MNYVFSTLTCDTEYATYVKGGGDVPRVAKSVTLKGGTGIASKHFVTPEGVMTEVSDEDLEFLKKHPLFQFHEKKKFVVVQARKVAVEKVVKDMEPKDASAPKTPSDFESKGEKGKEPTRYTNKK